jgi:hypothetical protein
MCRTHLKAQENTIKPSTELQNPDIKEILGMKRFENPSARSINVIEKV